MSTPSAKRSVEDLQAGNAFRETLVPRADYHVNSAPLWHGWALMEAYLAGLDAGRAQAATTSAQCALAVCRLCSNPKWPLHYDQALKLYVHRWFEGPLGADEACAAHAIHVLRHTPCPGRSA